MAFAVRDVFEAKLLPITAPQPAPGSPLFKYPVRRLIDSFDVPAGVAKYYAWMNTPDGDVRLWFVVHRGVWWRTAAEEWPKVRADIDAGHPSCLGIVAVRSANPVDLGRNHQVLAYAYEQDGHHVILSLYDPNADLDKADEVRVSFDTGQPSQAGPIVSNIDIADPVRGFFRLPVHARGSVRPVVDGRSAGVPGRGSETRSGWSNVPPPPMRTPACATPSDGTRSTRPASPRAFARRCSRSASSWTARRSGAAGWSGTVGSTSTCRTSS